MIASAPLVCPRFVGRENELALIVERYAEAADGSGTVVLIGGEAGIGKSRLLATARNVIEDRGGLVALGQCLQHAQSPMGPFSEVLDELHARDPSVFAESARLRVALARLVRDLDVPSGLQPSEAGDRRAQYGAIVDALRRFSVRQPVVIALEDIHWADLASLELLTYLAERIDAAKILVLVTYRSDEIHRQHPLTAALGRLGRLRNVWQIALPAMSRSEMHAFFSHTLGHRPRISGRQLSEIQSLAEGNPLFAEELLRHVVETEHVLGAARKLPLSVRAAVLERTTSLDDEGRTMLACAAAIGRRFDVDLLERISDVPAERIVSHLRQARDLQLILEEPRAYVFRHALFQEALYAELLVAEARSLHERIVRELESLPGGDVTIELAYHAWAASDRVRAGRYNEAAGDIAARRFAHHDAVRFYERALESASGDERAEAALYEKLGRALDLAAIGPQARRAFERALAFYERAGDLDKCSELAIILGQQAWFIGDRELSLTWRRRALDLTAMNGGSPWRLAALTSMIAQCSLEGDVESAAPHLEEAERLEHTFATEALLGLYNYRGMIERERGNVERMRADFERVAVAAALAGDVHAVCSAHSNVGYSATAVGDVATAHAALGEAIRGAREHFLSAREAYSVAGLAILHFLLGDFARARALVLDSAALSVDSEAPFIRIQAAAVAVALGVRTDDAELIERFALDETVELAFRTHETQRFGAVAAAFAELYTQRAEHDAARELLHRATVAARGISLVAALPIAVARYGDREDMVTMRALLDRWARPENRAGVAYLTLFDALAAQRSGRNPVAHATEAAARFGEIGFGWYEALAHETAGNQKGALALYRRIGAVADVRRLEATLNPVNRRGRAKSQLTVREGEVAALIAQGKSNKAIAEALCLSDRTVEHHVASILAKLEATSRSQIAATVTRDRSD